MTRDFGAFTDGAYTVSEVCRILQPSMTPRKVHYWLDTDLLTPSVVHGGRGTPTLLNFRQLLEIRTVQYLRDNLEFSLRRVRSAFEFILEGLFAPSFSELKFVKGPDRELVAVLENGVALVVPGGQGVMPFALPEMNDHARGTRHSWEARAFDIPERPHLVSNARVQAGSPTIKGTRIETAFIASFSDNHHFSRDTIDLVATTYPDLEKEAIQEAMLFEGLLLVS
jgi:uncharacterized protein (DUF433 family)